MRRPFRSGRLALAGLAAAFAAQSAAAAAPEPLFVPVFEQDFADPFVVLSNGEFTAYATNRGINLPMAASKDLIHWDYVRDANGKLVDGMPELGPWAKKDFTWAPEVMRVGTRWLLYYTARDRKRNIQCVGVAAADNSRGPFRDASEAPLVCQPAEGGTIDADPFRDADGKLYLYYKSDGNAVGKGTVIWGQRLAADGMSVSGEPVAMTKDDKAWEWKLVEAPMMVRSPAGHRLFYSAAYYGWNPDQRLSPYATGYATCAGPLGPCQDAPENPILHSFNDKKAGCLSGPGHPSVFQVGQRSFIAFHAWAATKGCRKAEDKRFLYVAPLMWENGKPIIGLSLRPPKAKN